MKHTIKLFIFALLIGISSFAIKAQGSIAAVSENIAAVKAERTNETKKRQSSQDEYYKTEIYGGYSWMKPTQGTIAFSKDNAPQGYEVSVTRNFNRFFGVKFATGGNFKTTKEVFSNSNDVAESSFYTYSGGVQFADNRKSRRIRPFGHVLVGGMRFKSKFTSTFGTIVNSSNESDNRFLMVFGGGLNVKVGRKISVRPFQFDYLLTNGGLSTLTSKGFIRLGAGVNLNF